MKLSERVAQNYKRLSENDIYIWNYISSHTHECETLPIELLASYCHVSKTTVLRFAKRIGLSGYSELKLLLKLDNGMEQATTSQIDTIQKGYNKYIDGIKKKNLSAIIREIHFAKNVYIHARGAVQRSVADELYRSFLPLNKLFFRIKTIGETHHYVQNITKGDVVVILSYSGESEESIQFAKMLKLKGAKVIAVTATKNNTLQQLADDGIYIEPVTICEENGIEHHCLGGYFILIDILFVSYLDFLSSLEVAHEH